MISAFGVVHEIAKADRRFKPETQKSGLYFPKHGQAAGNLRQIAQNKKTLGPAQAIRAGLRATKI